jgi:disulfide bond formation protein DsbB
MALIAMCGSLFYSEVLHLPPCVLCWYQRICMYPLVLFLGYAIYKRMRDLVFPSLILASVGWVISLYHNLLYFDILPKATAPCVAGISCTTQWPGWLSNFPIPAQALVAFTIIIIALTVYWKATKSESTFDSSVN